MQCGLTDMPKSGGAMAPPAPPGTTGLRGPGLVQAWTVVTFDWAQGRWKQWAGGKGARPPRFWQIG